MNALLAAWWLLAAPAVAAPAAPRTRCPGNDHVLALGLRGGPSFITGSQAGAWAPAPALGLVVDLPFSEYAGFSLDVEHALHRSRDGSRLLALDPDLPPTDPDAITGSQRHVDMDFGVKLGFSFVDETRWHPGRVVALPWFRMAAGFVETDTLVELPTFAGRETLRTRRAHASLDPGLGVAVVFPGRVMLQLAFEATALMGIDHDERTNADALRVTWRLEPLLDVLARF